MQEQRFQRVGGTETIFVDVRVLAATHQDLEDQRSKGRFREDLYCRRAVAVLHLPALRERLGDIVPLAEHFARQHGPDLGHARVEFLPEAHDRLRSHGRPGMSRLTLRAKLRQYGMRADSAEDAEFAVPPAQ